MKKGLRLGNSYPCAALENGPRPYEEGIKTVATPARYLFFWRTDPDLMKKGLRRGAREAHLMCGANGPRPYEEGIKTRTA